MPESAVTPPVLTPRQMAVLRLRASGRTNKAIALELGISTWTVKQFLTQAFRRLGVEGAVEAFTVMGWLRVPR